MSKKAINQNDKYINEFINSMESDFLFERKPIKRIRNTSTVKKIDNETLKMLSVLKNEINSIEDCNLRKNSTQTILGDGNINSPIMLVGEAPGIKEDKAGLTFMGESGTLLKKMLLAIGIKKENIYTTYAVNHMPYEDQKPSSIEIKRYSKYLKKHISIINPKIIILMGSSAMEALAGTKNKISIERGKWKEIIIKDISYSFIITFSPSYLLRTPNNKKYSWEDLKKIKQKIKDLNMVV